MHWIILIFSALAAALALVFSQLSDTNSAKGAISIKQFIHHTVVALPIIVTMLIAGLNYFRPGNKWVLLRAKAEAIKTEIFRYRTLNSLRILLGNDKKPYDESTLVDQINSTCESTMQTELNQTAISPYSGPIPPKGAVADGDDGFMNLDGEEYFSFRLEDQKEFYSNRAQRLAKKLKKFKWLILGVSGVGTFLAACGFEIWVALSTTLVGTLTTLLEYQQLENTMMIYIQARSSLESLGGSWKALSQEQKEDPEKIDVFVDRTENILLSEHHKWLKIREEGLNKIRKYYEREA